MYLTLADALLLLWQWPGVTECPQQLVSSTTRTSFM